MPGWIEGWKANMAKNLVIRKAAQALGEWLDRAGWTVESLDAALRADQPVLETAWADIPPETLAQARVWLRPLVTQLTAEDYPAILQELAANPAWKAFAELLYWHHYPQFAHSLTQLRTRLLDETP